MNRYRRVDPETARDRLFALLDEAQRAQLER